MASVGKASGEGIDFSSTHFYLLNVLIPEACMIFSIKMGERFKKFLLHRTA